MPHSLTSQLDPESPAPKSSRRTFLGATAGAVLTTIVSRPVLGGPAFVPPNERINLAGIGAGGMGGGDIATLARLGVNVVALCDVDDERAAGSYKAFPKARRYKDFRELLDKEAKHIDAVSVGTPDHIHAVATMAAIRAGKHVYCQKPLTRTLHECREVTSAAHKAGVATQMGNQGHATEGARLTNEWIRAGVIGTVREVHVWSDRAGRLWKQGIARPTGTPPVPATLNWDLWLGPIRERPYNPAYARQLAGVVGLQDGGAGRHRLPHHRSPRLGAGTGRAQRRRGPRHARRVGPGRQQTEFRDVPDRLDHLLRFPGARQAAGRADDVV